jgi:ATP-binding cassette subfamily B protein
VRDVYSEQALGKVLDVHLLKRLWRYVQPYRLPFGLALVCLPLTSGFLLAQPYILKLAIDGYIVRADNTGLMFMGLLFAGAVVGEFLFFYAQYCLTMTVAQKSLADLRLELFTHLQALPLSFFERNPVGRLVTRLTTDVDAINEAFSAGTLSIFMDLLTLTGIMVIMFTIEPRLALVTLSLLPLLLLLINFFRLRSRAVYRVIRERIARINAFLQETISGMLVVQLFAQEHKSFAEFERRNAAHRDANHLSNLYEGSLFAFVEAVSSISVALMLWYGGGQMLQGAVALGTLVAFIEYLQRFFVPIREFSAKYTTMQSAMTALERVFQLLDAPVTIASPALPCTPKQVQGGITFDQVWFAYRGEDWALRDVSFSVAPGERIALVGATGAGKTTLVKLLNRFYDVQRGRILVDGVDVREWELEKLRRQIGVVLQDVFLFVGDVITNVTLGEEAITLATVQQAARRVNAHEFISRLPAGYQEKIRERGSNLSSGQRQLLSFARALAYNPAILVLDEATSNVDPETELLIQDALITLMRHRTTLVIAHRFSTIQHVDRIIVMHKGQVREVGTHQELLAQQGIYWRLYQLQYDGRPSAPSRQLLALPSAVGDERSERVTSVGPDSSFGPGGPETEG